MAQDEDAIARPIESRDELVAYLEAGCKPRTDWRIGTEHEKIGFRRDDLRPVPYENDRSIQALLEGVAERFGWEQVMEAGNVVALKDPCCEHGGNITLEPGGQFELSGAPLTNIHETATEVSTHLRQVREVAEALNIGFLAIGFSPKWTLAETPVMPKQRYKIMRRYMPKVGRLGRDMMFRSATVQVNLDFSSEADMVKKLRVGLALQPLATAMFANSPFTDGKPNGFLSYRSELWRDTDPDRTGMLPFAFEDGMGFERYVDYALDVPMYFIKRGGEQLDVAGESFRDFMEGRLPALPGERPAMADWSDHLTTLFPEVRLKHFLEMRGADSGPQPRLCALPALWVGLMYDQTSLDAAWDMVKKWTHEQRETLRDEVPRHGLNARVGRHKVGTLSREMLAIARHGLQARDFRDADGNDESSYLEPLETIVAENRTPAEWLLEKYHGEWDGDIDHLFEEIAY
ncbi:glutamate--cysteine ligase [Dichotomicrobium thermohalophilum]|uniref:glutamate--cysteine ligase n=1 Tax=Dichotomicrobium thermohalophilum TaxID=933063 RepID=UPI000E5B5EA4|nr:glutamate--cysteine ligase [Dichotomicrobium thermohalophilum]